MVKNKNNSAFFLHVLRKMFRKYKKIMRINKDWRLRVRVGREKSLFASVIYDFDKRDFTVFVNDKEHGTVHKLKDTIIHENWHILLSPYTCKVDKLIEKANKGENINASKMTTAFKNEEERLVRKFTQIVLNLDRRNEQLEKKLHNIQDQLRRKG